MENNKLLQLLLILLILVSTGAALSGQEKYSLAEIIDLYKQKNINIEKLVCTELNVEKM